MGYVAMAALLALMGYLIRFRRWAWLISGYNTSSRATKDRYDLDALTRGVGAFCFALAGLLVVAGLGSWAGLDWVPPAVMVVLLVACLAFLVHANTGGRYLKRP